MKLFHQVIKALDAKRVLDYNKAIVEGAPDAKSFDWAQTEEKIRCTEDLSFAVLKATVNGTANWPVIYMVFCYDNCAILRRYPPFCDRALPQSHANAITSIAQPEVIVCLTGLLASAIYPQRFLKHLTNIARVLHIFGLLPKVPDSKSDCISLMLPILKDFHFSIVVDELLERAFELGILTETEHKLYATVVGL
ncbi:MAG: hypothetical protein QXP01_01250 [Candidatus Hadarchaeum sp.]